MKGYAEQEVFSELEMAMWHRATKFVAAVPDRYGYEVRCHELARAVGRLLNVPVVDGMFGGLVEHSWLSIPRPPDRSPTSVVLDVYVPGVIPQVQLVDISALLPVGRLYREEKIHRNLKIDQDLVSELVQHMSRIL